MRLFIKFLNDENAATAIEYGLIAAGISVAIISVVSGLGTSAPSLRPRSQQYRQRSNSKSKRIYNNGLAIASEPSGFVIATAEPHLTCVSKPLRARRAAGPPQGR